MTLFLMEFRAEATQVLGCGGLSVAFAGFSFADSFIVVEALAVLLLPSLDVLVLRHGDSVRCMDASN